MAGGNSRNREAFCRRESFFVNGFWVPGTSGNGHSIMTGQMYVESLEPRKKQFPIPIVLIHGDFHSGQIWTTKPDGDPGWASFFLKQGYHVYVVDLPPSGRSNVLLSHPTLHDTQAQSLSVERVEAELTAIGKSEERQPLARNLPLPWPKSELHDKWPGTGLRGDPIFDNYFASLVTMRLSKTERQTVAQSALQQLLKRIGKAVLIGEGTGGNVAWLAADIEPDLVIGTVALEPAGPPFGSAVKLHGGYHTYSSSTAYNNSTRPYGLTDIPLTYDPPLAMPTYDERGLMMPFFNLQNWYFDIHKGAAFMQREIPMNDLEFGAEGQHPNLATGSQRKIHELVSIKESVHCIISSQCSPHRLYDWATARFIRQAGVKVQWISLEDRGFYGNGHLMFLETNSDEIADLVHGWVQRQLPKKLLKPQSNVDGDEVTAAIKESPPKGTDTNEAPTVVADQVPVPISGTPERLQRIDAGHGADGGIAEDNNLAAPPSAVSETVHVEEAVPVAEAMDDAKDVKATEPVRYPEEPFIQHVEISHAKRPHSDDYDMDQWQAETSTSSSLQPKAKSDETLILGATPSGENGEPSRKQTRLNRRGRSARPGEVAPRNPLPNQPQPGRLPQQYEDAQNMTRSTPSPSAAFPMASLNHWQGSAMPQPLPPKPPTPSSMSNMPSTPSISGVDCPLLQHQQQSYHGVGRADSPSMHNGHLIPSPYQQQYRSPVHAGPYQGHPMQQHLHPQQIQQQLLQQHQQQIQQQQLEQEYEQLQYLQYQQNLQGHANNAMQFIPPEPPRRGGGGILASLFARNSVQEAWRPTAEYQCRWRRSAAAAQENAQEPPAP